MTKSRAVLSVAALALSASSAMASVTYNDNAFDVFTGAGGGILDILSVEVNNDNTDLTFNIKVMGDVVATDWGKYMVIIDSAPGGDTVSNGWARPISMPSGAETWLGSWVDSGNGLENRGWDGSAWQLNGATYNATPGLTVSKTTSNIFLSVRLADIGLVPGQTILLDVFTSGGGGTDGAIDSLGNPGQQVSDWGQASEAHPVSYRLVPGPGGALALAGAGLFAARRRRR